MPAYSKGRLWPLICHYLVNSSNIISVDFWCFGLQVLMLYISITMSGMTWNLITFGVSKQFFWFVTLISGFMIKLWIYMHTFFMLFKFHVSKLTKICIIMVKIYPKTQKCRSKEQKKTSCEKIFFKKQHSVCSHAPKDHQLTSNNVSSFPALQLYLNL